MFLLRGLRKWSEDLTLLSAFPQIILMRSYEKQSQSELALQKSNDHNYR